MQNFLEKGDSGEATINLEKNTDELEEISVTQESVGTLQPGIP